jgi:hypothetical protein
VGKGKGQAYGASSEPDVADDVDAGDGEGQGQGVAHGASAERREGDDREELDRRHRAPP